MYNYKLLVAAATLLAAAAGPALAQGPSAPTEPASLVHTAPSEQWQKIAALEAGFLAERLGRTSGPWHVRLVDENPSAFASTFKARLVSELTRNGVQLTTRPGGQLIDLQLAAHQVPQPQTQYLPGTLTLVTGGLWLVHVLAQSMSPAGALTVLAFGADAAMSNVPSRAQPLLTEVAVMVQATDGEAIKASQTNVYLVNDPRGSVHFNNATRSINFVR